MSTVTVTPFQVSDLNHELEHRGLGYRVHLHDMCGGQSLTVDELPEGEHDEATLRALAREFLGRDL